MQRNKLTTLALASALSMSSLGLLPGAATATDIENSNGPLIQEEKGAMLSRPTQPDLQAEAMTAQTSYFTTLQNARFEETYGAEVADYWTKYAPPGVQTDLKVIGNYHQ